MTEKEILKELKRIEQSLVSISRVELAMAGILVALGLTLLFR